MKKNSFVAMFALVVAVVGIVVAFAAYFRSKASYLYDEDDDYLFGDPEAYDNIETIPPEDFSDVEEMPAGDSDTSQEDQG